ncbi:MAG: hypothetical protein ACRDLM_03995 [Gaiellaceae bacterium]
MSAHNGSLTGPQRALLVLAALISAGVHAGLAPEHLHEWAPLGASFVAAAVALSAAAAALLLRPRDARPALALAALLTFLIAAYALTRLVALPPLDPDREPLDLLGLTTCAIEAAGVAATLRLARGVLRPATT